MAFQKGHPSYRKKEESSVEDETVAPDIEAVEAEEPPDVDDVAAQLAQLGAELQAVAKNKVAREAKLKDVEKVLSNLKILPARSGSCRCVLR